MIRDAVIGRVERLQLLLEGSFRLRQSPACRGSSWPVSYSRYDVVRRGVTVGCMGSVIMASESVAGSQARSKACICRRCSGID